MLAPGEEIKIAQKLDKLFDFADSGSGREYSWHHNMRCTNSVLLITSI